VRLNRRPEILTLAFSGAAPPEAPPSGGAPPGVPPLHVDYFGPAYQHNYNVPDVRTWQQRMRDRTWTIDVDGIYGPQSQGVCTSYQREKGLTVDGLVGPQTWTSAWTAPIT
jgi:peptidoglycan hydrolase-like protein with peptidoglycan-binding domain